MPTSSPPSRPGWIDPTTGRRIILAVSLLLAAYVAWQTYRQTSDWVFTVRMAAVAALSIWLVFRFALLLSRWLRGTREHEEP